MIGGTKVALVTGASEFWGASAETPSWNDLWKPGSEGSSSQRMGVPKTLVL